MRILYYSSSPNLSLASPSGYGTHMRAMIQAFEQAGHDVHPVIIGGMGEVPIIQQSGQKQTKHVFKKLMPSFVWDSVKDYVLLNKDLAFENYLKEEIVRIKPDLIYERASCLQLSGVQAAQHFSIPHVMEMNAPYVEERKDHFSNASMFERRAGQIEKQQLVKSDQVVVVSRALKKYFINKHKADEETFLVLPNAVDLDKIQVDPTKVAEIKTRFALEEKTVVGFVGSLFKWHGVDKLIRAIKLLRDNGFDAVLMVVGGGAILPELEELANTLDLSEYVFFTGSVPHEMVFSHIEAMDITVLANSHWYGSPVKLFEYGAMRKPIIAPANGPVQEVIEAEQDGLLIENEFDLERHLRRLMERPGLREKIAQSFHQKVVTRHTWQHNAASVLQNIERIRAATPVS